MKDSLFEMLLNLFEKTLTQLKEKHQSQNVNENDPSTVSVSASADKKLGLHLDFFKSANQQSMRIFTQDEQFKLTKASYQFLVRMLASGVISPDIFEVIINRLVFSESRFVALQETKWIIRNTMAQGFDAEQLAFLDLVLYHKEDEVVLH